MAAADHGGLAAGSVAAALVSHPSSRHTNPSKWDRHDTPGVSSGTDLGTIGTYAVFAHL